ncbi:BatD family protein, partial [Ignavibacterium album]|uniref:BatD family protein n=1 Tax=Ignavibacterium album TaxID=591197 RepID=UPI0038B2328F
MKRIFILIFLFLNLQQLPAQTFSASVDKNPVAENERFEVSFTFEGSDINSIRNFSPPSFQNFRILSGPNQSTSMQIINGAVSASRSYSYILLPNSTGTFTIGSASIEFKGQILKTEPLKITVVKGSPKPKDEEVSGVSENEIAKNLFIRASVDKSRAYLGEQVTVTYKLYTRLNIASQMSISKLPQYNGFWAEELETSRTLSFSTEVIDGKKYSVAVLKKAALFPTQVGKLEVTPFELSVPIEIPRKRNPNNIWDSFFDDPFRRGEIYQYNAKSNIVKVDVLPLPEQNKPASFKGAVGKFEFSATLDKSKTKTNEPISLKLSISGVGNISLLQPPDFELPAGFEKYEPKTNDQINRLNKISGVKTVEYLLIPRISGTREIKPVLFSYFDPDIKKYIELKSNPFYLTIEQGDSSASYYVAQKEGVQQLGTDIRFIKTNFSDIKKRQEHLINRPVFWIATALPLIVFIGLIGWKRKQDKLSGNIQLLKYQRAEKIARSKFKKALKFLEAGNSEAYYSEIAQAFFGYLENKL